jgi:hypothetical protein
MLDDRGPFGIDGLDLEEQSTAVIYELRDERLRRRVVELLDVVQSRPCIDDQVRKALVEIVREIVAARGLDSSKYLDIHLPIVERAFERIFWEEAN